MDVGENNKKTLGQGMGTKAVHAGEHRAFGSVTTPIVQTSTYFFRDTDEIEAFASGEIEHCEYGRYGNPTRRAAETKLAALDESEECLLFDCGMSAVSATVLGLVDKGQHVILTDDAYRKTMGFAVKVLPRFGIEATIVPMGDYEAMEAAIKSNTRLLITESPTNPYLNVADVELIAEFGRKHDVVTMIDSTFASPYNQKPLTMGVDLVLHSTTKYLAGHNDVLGGAVLGSLEMLDPIREWQRTTGGVADPNACYLLLRGMKTFAVRMERLNATAMTVAKFLESHPRVRKVYYPGLPSHRHHELAMRTMSGFGAVVTFELEADLERTNRFLNALKVALIAVSLGGPETLATHPATVSYHDFTPEERREQGILDELVRFSVGLEDPQDIMDDLSQALDAMGQ
jgi:cystathionine gamma-synthase